MIKYWCVCHPLSLLCLTAAGCGGVAEQKKKKHNLEEHFEVGMQLVQTGSCFFYNDCNYSFEDDHTSSGLFHTSACSQTTNRIVNLLFVVVVVGEIMLPKR